MRKKRKTDTVTLMMVPVRALGLSVPALVVGWLDSGGAGGKVSVLVVE